MSNNRVFLVLVIFCAKLTFSSMGYYNAGIKKVVRRREVGELSMKYNTKFIVITGGVCSSLGKGVLVSSLGVLLKNSGYSVSVVKWDPYLNVDPGTMSPLEHGEVFVTADGAETDLDLGHYERTIGVQLGRDSSVSSGQIFQEILDGERKGTFLGRCIQLVPHVVDAIKNRLLAFTKNHDVDFVLVEIGGTVGDMEGKVFLEAIRQLRMELPYRQLFHGHLSLVPLLEWTREFKTKPTQHSVNMLKEAGLAPDGLFLRLSEAIPRKALEKVGLMCGVDVSYIFQVCTFKPIYQLFIDLNHQQLGQRVQEYFGLPARESDLTVWQGLIDKISAAKKIVRIGVIAKYMGSNDPYISVIEAIKAAAYAYLVHVEIVMIEADVLETPTSPKYEEEWDKIKTGIDGIVCPGGFDTRGVEGKIAAVAWAREHQVPYLGLCLGLQVMLIEFARSLLGLTDAQSTEFDKASSNPVIVLLEEQKGVEQKGASMRLGSYACSLVPGSKAYQAYQKDEVLERHRHRYEFNNAYREALEEKGIVFSGLYKAKDLIEIAELKDHSFMVGSQFHPEFLSSPLHPHPLFKAFMGAVLGKKEKKDETSV